MRSRFVAALTAPAAVLLLSSVASAQSFLGAISTAGQGQNTAEPYGLAFGPNGDLYVAIAGRPAFVTPDLFNNNVVVRIDASTNAIASTIQVGLFPEEIAFAAPAGGSPVGLVSNSTDGTVTIFDLATEATLATVTLPGGFLGSFPFGIVVNAAGTRAYVSVVDGTPTLRAIDLDPASATVHQHLPAEDLTLASGSAARLVRDGSDVLCPTSSFGAGSTGSFERHPLPGSGNATASVALGSDPTFSTFPGAQDVALAPNGIAYVAGFDLSRRIYGYHVASGALVRSFPGGTIGAGQVGLALSPDGKVLVVCDVLSDEVAFLDVERGLPIAVVNTLNVGAGYGQPNDALFSADGSTVYVTVQGSEAVLRFAAPPAPAPFAPPLGLAVAPTAPAQGSTVAFATFGAQPGELVGIFIDVLDGALDFGPAGVFHLTPAAQLVASATGSDAAVVLPVPSGAGLFGVNVLCQAVAVDLSLPSIRLSDEIPVVLQQ